MTIVLSQVKAATKWPAALEGDRFVDDKKVFEEIADKARKEDEEGDISPDTLRKAHDLVSSLRPSSKPCRSTLKDSQEARGLSRRWRAWSRCSKRPIPSGPRSVADGQDHVARQPDRVHARLQPEVRRRHDPPSTHIYDHLYPLLDEVRDRIMRESKVDETRPPRPIRGTSATSSTNWISIRSRAKKKETPRRPIPSSEIRRVLIDQSNKAGIVACESAHRRQPLRFA